MESTEKLKEINSWFSGPQDLEIGLKLLRTVSKKYKLMENIRRGILKDPNTIIYKRSHERLAHELGLILKPKTIPPRAVNCEDNYHH